MKTQATLLTLIIAFLLLLNIKNAYSQNVIWEIFNPRPENIQQTTGAPWQKIFLDSLVTIPSDDLITQTRIRGYILPPQTGYYKFYMASDMMSQFYLSTDSTEFNQNLICASTYYDNYYWPDSIVNADSVLLEINKPYYFEAFCNGWYWNNCCNPWIKTIIKGNYLKIGWVLPDSNKLQVITGDYLKPAKPKQSYGVNWEIYKNLVSYDFSNLKTTDSVPNEINRLDSIITTNHATSLDHFASRIRGYLIPPVSGNYSFYFACDNVGQFWLSSDTSLANAQLKSNVLLIQTDWTQNISTQTLVAGQKYFFEILHYDTVYIDQIKLGWKIPGDTVPVVIKTPHIIACGDDTPVSAFSFIENEITLYPNWTSTPIYHLTPWNASNKTIKWVSSNTAVATVNADGIISTLSQGSCEIIASMVADTTVADTLQVDVTDYSGPYFVKQNASVNGNGHSWDNAITLTKLLDILNQGPRQQQITVCVAEGVYKPTTTFNRNETFTLKSIRLLGGFASTAAGIDTINRDIDNNETILSGEIGEQSITDDNSYHVVVSPGNTTIDGFTIRDGRADCSIYGFEFGLSYYKSEDNGGGVLASLNVSISNCRITNNSAFSGGSGIYCRIGDGGWDTPSILNLKNTTIYNNIIQQPLNSLGGTFNLQVNGNGAGINMYASTLNAKNCLFYNNNAAFGHGSAIYLSGSFANFNNCSFFKNAELNHDIYSTNGSNFTLNKSTVVGSLINFFYGTASIKNSTIIGGFIVANNFTKNSILLDNTIITSFDRNAVPINNFNVLTDSCFDAKYCILGNSLFGASKVSVISDIIPPYSSWLDTLAYNGGNTPTLKLKTVPVNPAIGNGNPIYLDSLDQRGIIRADSVSIGAYQWKNPMPVNQIDSVDWEIFENITAYDFDTLKNTESIPEQVVKLTSINTPDHLTTLDHFASRIRGYIIPPYDGNYTFYFACDNVGQFWLSSDTSVVNAQLKSNILSAQTDWNQNTSVQMLVAGQKYFFEILHYDTVYTDQIKLGWKIPGDTVPVVIHTPYIVSSGDNVPASTFSLSDDEILAYPTWNITPRYTLTPWNAANKNILWHSSNTGIATINALGVIHSVAPGVCQITGTVAGNTSLKDSLTLTVTDYYGPYFVKQNASVNGIGHSWEDAISLPKLLEILNQGTPTQSINVFVAQGTYKPTTSIDRNKSFIINNIRIVGGFPDDISGIDTTNRDLVNQETILSGEIGVPGETLDNSFHVIITRGTAIIDGLTIRDGRANCRYYGDANYYEFSENSGGGIILQSENAFIYNCKIINNSAYNGGAGIYCGSQSPTPGGVLWGKMLTIANTQISDNIIQQTVDTGAMFIVIANGYGPGIAVISGTCNLKNCIVNNNIGLGAGKAVFISSSSTFNIENCSFYDNYGSSEDIWIKDYSTLNLKNSTVIGSFVTYYSNSNIINSTIVGGGYVGGDYNSILFDNSIWTNPNLNFYNGATHNSWQTKYSILGDTLFGYDKDQLLFDTLPAYTIWLDTLAYNGGFTPTMKLKTVPNNPATGNGNPLYLDSLDQRGVIRADSVSIGAYQWKNPMPVNQIDSVDWEIFENITAYDFDTLKNTEVIPDQVVKLTSINTPDHSTTLDHFSSRIRGYIIPPYDGNYTFYFACDNVGQFWLSSDTSVVNAQLKSNILSAQTDWNQNTSVQTLIAGQKYFFEILHYDTVYTDQIKLGWKIPGDTVPVVIHTPYIVSSGDNIPVSTFSLLDHEILAYPLWNITPRYHLTPWNAANKKIIWQSSNTSVATINTLGVIHTVAPGVCQIIGTVAGNTVLSDTLTLTVTDYYGPYFVKPTATASANGHSWENAISLPVLLRTLSKGNLLQKVTIYASEGTYKPTTTIDRNKTFTINNTRLVGGFSESSTGTDTTNRDFQNYETILSGEIGVPGETLDNSYHVVVASRSAVIDGFTIRDGRASCSTYGYTPGYYSYKNDDNGGGILIPQTKSNVIITNCKVTNNSAWNSGAGICCTRSSININQASVLSVLNSSVNDNSIQLTYITSGGIFNIQVNGHGAGISMITATLNTTNSKYFNNSTAFGYGKAIYLENGRANIDKCSIYKNIGNYEDLWAMSGSIYNINNSTIVGKLVSFFVSTVNLNNSTVSGGGYVGGSGNHINIDNSIWTNINLSQIPDTNLVTVKYSILGNSLYGSSKNNIISNTVPAYSIWLDTLAFNGGPTPTMKLKTVPNNPAKSNGNIFYLNTPDQRGAIRSDSVSIGAYQWVRPTNISIMPQQIILCQGDSIDFAVTVMPDLVSDTSYTKTSSNNSVALVTGTKIYALAPGNADIIVHSTDGGLADTCIVTVMEPVGTGTITGETSVCQGQNSVTYTITGTLSATSYTWILPTGATGSSYTNTITVNFDSTAVSGNISVIGQNICGEGAATILPITVKPLVAEAGIISGASSVCIGQNSVIYTVPAIANATSYIWTLPVGASGSSDTNNIVIEFGLNAVSGEITVKGINSCGDGASSTKTITVNPVYSFTENHSICNGETYTWQGNNYTSAGIYTANYSIVNGCDSIYTLNLTVNPVYAFTENHSICNGETYTWQGTDYTSAGIYTANYSSVSGCDSIYTLNLTVNPVYAFTENHSICSGETYTWQGNDYTMAGTYSANYSSVSGCDSIYTLNLIVNPVYAFTENHSICSGETYTWQGNDYTMAGTYSANYSSVSGCDSIYTLNLTVNPVYAFTENHSICSGETYTWQGNDYTMAGTYSANYSSVSGCDSIYTLNLTVNPVYAFTKNHSICSGETYTWQGNDYTMAGTYSANYSSVSGCDSIYTLTLTVFLVEVNVTLSGITITANAIADAYQWMNCDAGFAPIAGAINQSYTATSNGNYSVAITQAACTDTSECIQVLGVGLKNSEKQIPLLVYPNPFYNQLIVELKGNTQYTDFEIVDALGQVVFKGTVLQKEVLETKNLSPGIYVLKLKEGKCFRVEKIIKE